MKVVHVCTADKGGAGIAAVRLHKALLAQGVNSSFLSLYCSGTTPAHACYKTKPPLTYLQKLKSKLGIPVLTSEKNANILKTFHANYEIFSFPESDYKIEQHPLLKDADIINLHWVSGFLNYPTFFNAIKKPIVWTLHDMNPFLGGFHYMGDKVRNTEVMGNLEKSLLEIKVNSYILSNINLIAPSKWLYNEVKKSVFKNHNSQVIYNSLDMSVFKLQSASVARQFFNLPENKTIILFVAQDTGNFRKGFDLLSESLNNLPLTNDIVLVCVGAKSTPLNIPKNCIFIDTISEENKMSLLYAAADLYILPSREDNLPNVMLESLSCGTPVIAFSNGGMKEIIKNGFNGFIADDCNSENLSNAISKGLQFIKNMNRLEIRKDAETIFESEIQSKAYINLYQQLL